MATWIVIGGLAVVALVEVVVLYVRIRARDLDGLTRPDLGLMDDEPVD